MTADIAHIADELNALSSFCEETDEGVERGWTVSSWLVSERALEALIDTYRALLLVVDDDSEVAEQLARDGVDLTDLLIDAESAEDAITRADLCELAAAAWMLTVDGLRCPMCCRYLSMPSATGTFQTAFVMNFSTHTS
jgi:hypothetical protein